MGSSLVTDMRRVDVRCLCGLWGRCSTPETQETAKTSADSSAVAKTPNPIWRTRMRVFEKIWCSFPRNGYRLWDSGLY